MTRFWSAGIAGAVIVAGVVVGLRLDRDRPPPSMHLPGGTVVTSSAAGARKVLYWKAPGGGLDVSASPKSTAEGLAYLPVYDHEEKDVQRPPPVPVAKAGGKIKFYRNPMGLPDTSPTPKKDQMGMDYIPVFEGAGDDGDTITLSPAKIQRTGVETVVVGPGPVRRTIKAPGVVTQDERLTSVIAPRFDGFVVSVGAATTGTHVKQGDPLATVFGQELLAQGARLIVEQGWSGNEGATLPGARNQAVGAVGARRRLLNMGAPPEFIAQIERERRVPDTITVRAPRDGVILERNIVEGQGFKAGDVAFRIADHTLVWVLADIAESDLDAVKPGQMVTLTTRARPGRVFSGSVAIIYPHLMKETRTARVRIELPNPDLALLPDMYGEVDIATNVATAPLVVPASAVIDSGNRQIVLMVAGEGRFVPRDVRIGRRGDGMAEVVGGLAAGDKVVVNGNFLIDSESNLQSALKGFAAAPVTETPR